MGQAMNACIVSFFMNNIDMKTVEYNKRVVEKFNKSKYPHYHINTQFNHGASMDMFWTMNGCRVKTFPPEHNIPMNRFNHDVVVFLDIDCLPLTDRALDYLVSEAAQGILAGNVQRSNHIQNNQHLFAAPSALSLSRDMFVKIGYPSALPTKRGDVAEEYTYAMEEHIQPTLFLMPLEFEEAPAECPSWALKDGMPVYGRGTTFGFEGGAVGLNRDKLFWHQFQSFHPGQQAKFWKKCEDILNGSA